MPGHWEGDLIIGLQRSAIGTLVERTTRFTMLVHLPREIGYGVVPRTKNGPALAGYGAVSMSKALAATVSSLPDQLRRSLTWDRGKEMSQHAQFRIDTGVAVYFADPKSPWQRGTTGELDWAVSADSTIVRAHQHGATARREPDDPRVDAESAASLRQHSRRTESPPRALKPRRAASPGAQAKVRLIDTHDDVDASDYQDRARAAAVA